MKPLVSLFALIAGLGTSPARAADYDPVSLPQRIAALRAEIARHDERYHRDLAPVISDDAYDRLRRELAALEARDPAAARALAPLPAFGDDRTGRLPPVRHGAPMLSLAKAHTREEREAFHRRMVQALGREEIEYVVEPKLDGLAVSLVYEAGRLVRAATRGNGREGEDITATVAALPAVPAELAAGSGRLPWPARFELRGELYVPWADFERINDEREAAGEPRYASPRALAAGAVRQREPAPGVRGSLRLACFALVAGEPSGVGPASQRDLQAALGQWGLPGVPAQRAARGWDAVEGAVGRVREERAEAPYPTDGAVVKLNLFAEQRLLGEAEAAPRWAMACKFDPERAETRVRAITIQVGRTGVLTPVAELAPVRLGGSVVARATLHNFDDMARKDVRVGDLVYVEKAGDVIPGLVGVDLERRPPEAKPYAFPIACPECFAPVVREKDVVARRCSGESCPGQLRRRIEHFASPRAMDIAGLGPAWISVLVGHGWVRDLPDLYRLKRADLLALARDNVRSVDQLLAAIDRSRHAELWRVIHGLGLPQVGAVTAKELAQRYGSLAALSEHGPARERVLRDEKVQRLLAELGDAGVVPMAAAAAGGPLSGKVFVLTGTLPTWSRAEATARIEAAGGRVAATVSRGVHYVVVGADPGAKRDRARALGVPQLDEAGLQRLLAAPRAD